MSMVAKAQSSAPGEDIAFLGVRELAKSFRRRELSPVDVANRLVDRIEAINPTINAMVHIDRAYTLRMAEDAERRFAERAPLSQLDGIPLTIKDLSRVIGMPLRRGSLAFNAADPIVEDSPCVARLREAGTVFLGKTATPDAGCRIVTRSAVHGVTANPYDLTKTSGGSSGGASAALAVGFGPLAVGTDGAGSLRIPASSTNIFAIKPGFGRVPHLPAGTDMPMAVVGPMARTVADATAMLQVISMADPRDPFTWPVPFTPPTDLENPDLSELKVAISPRLGQNATLVDPEVDALIASATPLLESAGAKVYHDDPEWPVDPLEPFMVFWDTAYADTANGFSPDKQSLLDPVILRAAEIGRQKTMTEIFRAMQQRIDLSVYSKAFFVKYDLLIGPTMPVPPYAIEREVPIGFADDDWNWCPYTYIWNMTGQPAATVPIGFTESGLPVGVQIIGPMGSEANILRAAAAIERRRPFHLRRPPMV